MVGDRGSGSNTFSFFLIFILLYLAQKGTYASAYSVSIKPEGQPEQPETPMEGKVAVGLANGEVAEYIPDSAVDSEEDYADLEPVAPVQEQEDEQIMDDTLGFEEEDFPTEEFASDHDESNEEIDDVYEEIEAVNETFEEEPIEEESQVETEQAPVEEESFQEAEEDQVTPDWMIEELFEVSSEEEFAEVEQNQQPLAETTVEPIMGGQDHLFLKPVINDSKFKKTEHTGPKISIRFGS